MDNHLDSWLWWHCRDWIVNIHQVLPFGIFTHASVISVLVNDIHYNLNNEIKSFHVVSYWNVSYLMEGRFLMCLCICPCVHTNFMFLLFNLFLLFSKRLWLKVFPVPFPLRQSSISLNTNWNSLIFCVMWLINNKVIFYQEQIDKNLCLESILFFSIHLKLCE